VLVVITRIVNLLALLRLRKALEIAVDKSLYISRASFCSYYSREALKIVIVA